MDFHTIYPAFYLKKGVQGLGIFSAVKFKKGDIVFEMTGKIKEYPTRTSIQVGKHQHIEDEIGIHVNHSCYPNTKINRKARLFICLQDIQVGEEITFDYNKNEDYLAAPFNCHCCNKKIIGKYPLQEII